MMERSDIYSLSEEILGDFFERPPQDASSYILRMTSGTSGSTPLVLVTDYHPDAKKDFVGADFKNFLALKGSLSARLANLLLSSRVPVREVRTLALDAEDLKPGLEELLADFGPDVVNGFCSFVSQMLGYVSPVVSARVKRVVLLGETLGALFEQKLAQAFPRAELVEMYMALEVGGYIASRYCRSLPRGNFHPARGVTVEISDPDQNGVGDILISKTIFRGKRIERYRIGDVGRIVPGTCACGETRTLELLGRRDIDRIKLGPALFTREEFDRVMAKFPDLIDDYRVEVKRSSDDPSRGSVEVYLFRRAGSGTKGLAHEVADKISRSLFVTQSKTYHDLVLAGVLESLHVEYRDMPFEKGHKDIKLRARVS